MEKNGLQYTVEPQILNEDSIIRQYESFR
jgi:hypothetical protein